MIIPDSQLEVMLQSSGEAGWQLVWAEDWGNSHIRLVLSRAALCLMLMLATMRGAVCDTTSPSPVTSTNVSGTIATTGTFQSVLAATSAAAPRKGCLIQNNGTGFMFVFAGPIASATEAKSYQLQPPTSTTQGGSFSCATLTGAVLQDQISITGTGADTFTASSQP